MKKLKNIVQGSLMSLIIIIELIAVLMLNLSFVPSALIFLPAAIMPACVLSNNIMQNQIEKNLFRVTKKGKIQQNSFGDPIHFFKTLKEKDKQKVFIKEVANMFNQLEQYTDKGQLITYNTKSQPLTKYCLSQLADDGYITNFTFKKVKKSSLFFEKLTLGNLNGLFKKYNKYLMTFNVTGKKLDDNYIELLNNSIKKRINSSSTSTEENIEDTVPKTKQEMVKDTHISREKEIRELKTLRESLVDDSEQITSENKHKL
ncbi:MAG: hypothetical protein IJR82_02250 [Bacilli bacterium]|nr:hypothetical protein [Bacilli bacterium]